MPSIAFMAFAMLVKLTNAQFLTRSSQHSARRKGEFNDLLLLKEVNKFNVTILAKVPLQPLIGESFKIFHVPNIDISRCAGMHGQSELRVQWTRIFTPTNLEATVI